MKLRKKIFHRIYKPFMLDHFRRFFIGREWEKIYGYKIDWDHPRDLNEKIQWLLCYSDISMWSVCADKYMVRDYVKSKGLGDLLVPLLGVWDKVEDIDFDCENPEKVKQQIVEKLKNKYPKYEYNVILDADFSD